MYAVTGALVIGCCTACRYLRRPPAPMSAPERIKAPSQINLARDGVRCCTACSGRGDRT